MNCKKICGIIKKIEKKNLKKIYYKNINFSPLLRLTLFEILGQSKKKYIDEISLSSLVIKLYQISISLFNYFFYYFVTQKKTISSSFWVSKNFIPNEYAI